MSKKFMKIPPDGTQGVAITQLRVKEDLYLKAKILAAICDESFNGFVVKLLEESIKDYESEHGEMPKPLLKR
jgi:hypothetical protein